MCASMRGSPQIGRHESRVVTPLQSTRRVRDRQGSPVSPWAAAPPAVVVDAVVLRPRGRVMG
jgi:hypothetical protein